VTSIAFTSLFLGLVLGTHPVGVAVEGPATQVAFEVDGRPAGQVAKQPWTAQLDLGRDLEPHELVARALDAGGREVARVEQWLNVPRPPSEASLLLETNAEGKAVSARLTWQSLLGTPPRSIEITLELASPRFYHLDTCFCPLAGGKVLYHPAAFTSAALAAIHARVAPNDRIEASEAEAAAFCVNAVNLGSQIVMAKAPASLRRKLAGLGYALNEVDLAPFILSGGAAYCMTLRLDRASGPQAAVLAAE